MTGIRELLDEATRDVVTDAHDATERVRRGLRARRQQSAAIAAVIAVVIAAIVVPLSLTGGGKASLQPANPNPQHVPVLQRWTNEDGAVATGFGAIWALHTCRTTTCHAWVDKLDPDTGKQLARVTVPAPATQLAADLGAVWVLGSTSVGNRGALTLINASHLHQVYSVPLTPPAIPHGIVFSEGRAWISFPTINEVRSYAPDVPDVSNWPNLTTGSISIPDGPTNIATTGDGQVWVQHHARSGQLTQLRPVSPKSGHETILAARTVSWGSPIFSAISPPKTLLALGAGATVGTLAPSFLNGCSACAQGGGFFAKGSVNAVLQTSRGWWIATSKRTYFYDHKSFRSGGQPTASLSGQASSLAPDGRGVIVGNPIIGLFRWTPQGG